MNHRKVPIKNILFIFSYIWDEVKILEKSLNNCDDDFDAPDILAKLFIDNVNNILKKGLYCEYHLQKEEIRGIKGKLDFNESLNQLSFQNAKAVCAYDVFEENNLINQIIKTTAYKLYRLDQISDNYKRELYNILLYFKNVEIIKIEPSLFNIRFNRNNQYTKLVIMICELINKSLMLSENIGNYHFVNILDDDKYMEKIFEKFINVFYKVELNDIYNTTYQKELYWKMTGDDLKIVPIMKLDTFLDGKKNNKAFIIDTKYYTKFLSENNIYWTNETKEKLITDNLYQMYAYMNHIDTEKELTCILLYPMPYSENKISKEYSLDIMSNGLIKKSTLKIQTINLNDEWRTIKQNLFDMVN